MSGLRGLASARSQSAVRSGGGVGKVRVSVGVRL